MKKKKLRKTSEPVVFPKADMIYHTGEWLVTAFASTLVFIIFIMQVYRIPTGSMAETLQGAHFRLRCEQCGYPFGYDFSPQQYGYRENVIPDEGQRIKDPVRCPSCGFEYRTGSSYDRYAGSGKEAPVLSRTVFKGDQIFVLKCIYQFLPPRRWDVVVFKNPTEPKINFIKRLIALPGETVEIIDGDIYIDGLIARKPGHVQEELWMPIYRNDFHPARPEVPRFNGHTWRQPFVNQDGAQWDVQGQDYAIFALEGSGKRIHRLEYSSRWGNGFRAAYAYDPPKMIPNMPIVSDLMLQFYPRIASESAAGAELRKYGRIYQGWVHADGRMQILSVRAGEEPEVLAEEKIALRQGDKLEKFQFSNADHQLILEYGNRLLTYDLGREPADAGTDFEEMPGAAILGYGNVRLMHVGLFRDIHYLVYDGEHPERKIFRAGPGDPFKLGTDEFFVCGDNSPLSADSRWWHEKGKGNNGSEYPAGVVPMDFFVGKAFFVHWPGGYKPAPRFFRLIPYLEGMKVIYGGKYGAEKVPAKQAE